MHHCLLYAPLWLIDIVASMGCTGTADSGSTVAPHLAGNDSPGNISVRRKRVERRPHFPAHARGSFGDGVASLQRTDSSRDVEAGILSRHDVSVIKPGPVSAAGSFKSCPVAGESRYPFHAGHGVALAAPDVAEFNPPRGSVKSRFDDIPSEFGVAPGDA